MLHQAEYPHQAHTSCLQLNQPQANILALMQIFIITKTPKNKQLPVNINPKQKYNDLWHTHMSMHWSERLLRQPSQQNLDFTCQSF